MTPNRTTPDTEPRVGIVSGSLSRSAGGVFFAIRDVANRLQARGMPQALFGLHDTSFEADRAEWRVAELHSYPAAGPKAFKVSRAMLRGLRGARLDLLHLHGIWNFPSLAALLWRRATGRPLVISPHGMLDPGALLYSGTKKRIAAMLYERANLRGAAAIHALNAAEAQAVRDYGLTVPIAVIPNGVDVPPEAVVAARDWSPDTRRTLLFLARIHPKKGVQELVAAWRAVLDRDPAIGERWHLVIAGWDDGGLLDTVRQQVATLDLTDHVTLPGALFGAEKHAAYASAHAFILPSRSEGLPISVLEAWSYGLPVFMTEACNLPSGFAADAALRVETDLAALAAVLSAHLSGDDPARLKAIGQNGRALVERDFTWDRAVDAYVALYQWLARGGEAPAFVQQIKDRP